MISATGNEESGARAAHGFALFVSGGLLVKVAR